MAAIISFSGPYRFLSNFYISPMYIDYATFDSVENYFQAQKTKTTTEHEKIRLASPSQAKALGRKVPLPKDWDEKKYSIMKNAVHHKFVQNRKLLQLLYDTGTAYLMEGNNRHDNYWGACWCQECRHKEHKNMLGLILMRARREL